MATGNAHVNKLLAPQWLDERDGALGATVAGCSYGDIVRAYAENDSAIASHGGRRNGNADAGRAELCVAVLAHDAALHEVHRRAADEARDELVERPAVELHRRRNLLQRTILQYGDAGA